MPKAEKRSQNGDKAPKNVEFARPSSTQRKRFKQHLSKKKVADGLKNGTLFEATIRYNASDTTQAFCTVDGLSKDVFINGVEMQNRSVHGDIVVIRILPEDQWYESSSGTRVSSRKNSSQVEVTSDSDADTLSMMSAVRGMLEEVSLSGPEKINASGIERIRHTLENERCGWRATGEVVYIKKPSERRASMVGFVRQERGLVFVPSDSRLPKGYIENTDFKCDGSSRGIVKNMENYYEASIIAWNEKDGFPRIKVKSMLGKPGTLETDIQALLKAEKIDDGDLFDEEVLKCLPETPWRIPQNEYSQRRDLRTHRIFSIDPETAKDLDDALSIEPLEHGKYRIGVHIADVSYFVETGSKLDEIAQQRSTSVYLVDRVIPMLPRMLCEELCSLNPGTERLAMSIIWDMDNSGEIMGVWIGRTVIKSCIKLSYQQAQEVIDEFESTGRIPSSSKATELRIHGRHSESDICHDIINLHKIAKEMRKARAANGALRLDNAKVAIKLKEGEPEDFFLYQVGSANHLVEEFMLAANISAATFISSRFPDRSLLRRHPEPNMEKLQTTASLISSWAQDSPSIDTGSAGSIQASLRDLAQFYKDAPEVLETITFMCTKPMQMAQYFNTGDVEIREQWKHYALSVPLYTHFTSPIRRYPDIIVHRLILAALRKKSKPKLGVASVSEVAEHANERKLAAKVIQERVTNLYLVKHLRDYPRVFIATVCGLGGPRFFDIYVPDLGVDIRIHAQEIFLPGGRGLRTKWISEKRTLQFSPTDNGLIINRKAKRLEQTISNAHAIDPEKLPFEMTPFSRVAVVVYGKYGEFGNLDTLAATIWLGL
ncbi:DIS3-like exonuclease 2 [Picochlorum sp. SENEW3]|nr:DIS3-like exonuclease 2 [Picochlorum sp. SENEW3]